MEAVVCVCLCLSITVVAIIYQKLKVGAWDLHSSFMMIVEYAVTDTIILTVGN